MLHLQEWQVFHYTLIVPSSYAFSSCIGFAASSLGQNVAKTCVMTGSGATLTVDQIKHLLRAFGKEPSGVKRDNIIAQLVGAVCTDEAEKQQGLDAMLAKQSKKDNLENRLSPLLEEVVELMDPLNAQEVQDVKDAIKKKRASANPVLPVAKATPKTKVKDKLWGGAKAKSKAKAKANAAAPSVPPAPNPVPPAPVPADEAMA